MLRHRSFCWVLMGAFALVPHLALAQANKAGVVTALSGRAAVARTTAPQPLPLRFKDDVLFQDRVTTERDSIVKLLLGGKAVVTIRELSDFSIVEEPNHAVVNLGLGQVALQVLRRLLLPGESVEVHTPNAIASVRGSFLYTKCAQGAVGAAVQCDFTTLEVSQPVKISSPTDPSLFTFLAANQSTSVFDVGGAIRFGQTINISPDQAREIRGLSQGPPPTPGAPGNLVAAIGTAGMGQATILANALNTGGGTLGFLPPLSPPASPAINTSTLGVNQATATTNAPSAKPAGNSPPPPAPVGKGTIEPNYGAIITLFDTNHWCDDCTTNISFGFSFPFLGGHYDHGELSSNGFLTLGGTNGNGCCNAYLRGFGGFLDGAPRIAVGWYDLFPVFPGPGGTVHYNTFPGRAVVTFDSVPEFPASPPGNTFQMQIFSDGKILLLYPTISPPSHHTSLVGVTQGGGIPDSATLAVNFSTITTTLNTGTVGTVYQLFSAGTFVPQGAVIIFQPNGQGGWLVLDPPYNGGALLSVANGQVVTQNNPLLANPPDPQLILGAVAQVTNGQLVVSGSAGPLVSLTGGPHHLAILPGTSMFDLAGSGTALETVEGNTLTLGTDRPLRGDSGGSPAPLSAPLLQTAGATVDTEKVVTLDSALLEASAPLLNLTAGSTVTSSGNVLDLVRNAKLVANIPADALIKLSASTLSVYNGALVNVAGGSFLNVTGSLVSLANGSTLNVLNGALISVSGGSVFKLTGGFLAVFGAGTNTLNISNAASLCAGCSIVTSIPNLTGIPVLLVGGASAANVMVAPGFKPFAGLGPTNKVSVTGASGAVLAVNGAASKVVLKP